VNQRRIGIPVPLCRQQFEEFRAFTMADIDRWEKIRPLGEGGQGRVSLVRRPARTASRQAPRGQIRSCIGGIGGHAGESSDSVVQRLLQAIGEYNRIEDSDELGALKEFQIPPDDKAEEARAVGRLRGEVQALESINHPAVLKLLHHNISERFIVTEYHPNGTLDKQLHRYKGNVLKALEAFRPLVDAVVEIHSGYHPSSAHERQIPRAPAIHRDIKPANIFRCNRRPPRSRRFWYCFFPRGGGTADHDLRARRQPFLDGTLGFTKTLD